MVIEKLIKKNISQIVFEKGGPLLSSDSVHFIKSLKNTYVNLYRIKRLRGKEFIVKSLVHPEKDPSIIILDAFSKEIQDGDLFALRILDWDGELHGTNIILHFADEAQEYFRAFSTLYLLRNDCYEEDSRDYKDALTYFLTEKRHANMSQVKELNRAREEDVYELEERRVEGGGSCEASAEDVSDEYKELLRRMHENERFATTLVGVETYAVSDWKSLEGSLARLVEVRSLGKNLWDVEVFSTEKNHLLLTFLVKTSSDGLRVVLQRAEDGEAMQRFLNEVCAAQATLQRHESMPLSVCLQDCTFSDVRRVRRVPALIERILIVEDILNDYYQLLDEQWPELNGKTPRQAVRLRTYRPKVQKVLKILERNEKDLARIFEREPADLSFLWKEQCLTPPSVCNGSVCNGKGG